MTTVRARSRRAISLLITTGLLTGLVFASAPVAEAGRGGCKVTNGTASYAGLARAIKLAAAGSTLTIANTCVGRFTIGKDLTLVGTDQSSTLDGNGGGTVLTIQTGATVTIRQLRITNGFANRGGGIYNLGTVSMTDGAQVVANSAATAGGGIHNDGGYLYLSGSAKVSGNLALYGAGISNRNGLVSLSGTAQVSGNGGAVSTQSGGGVYNGDPDSPSVTGTLTLSGNASVWGNTARDGGGIFSGSSSAVTLSGSAEVTDNTAGSSGNGGGIYNNGTLTMANGSSVSDNTAAFFGGGIFNTGTVTMSDSSKVSGNTAAYGGGLAQAAGTFTLAGSSAVSGNSASGSVGGAYVTGGSVTSTGGTISGNTNGDCVAAGGTCPS